MQELKLKLQETKILFIIPDRFQPFHKGGLKSLIFLV